YARGGIPAWGGAASGEAGGGRPDLLGIQHPYAGLCGGGGAQRRGGPAIGLRHGRPGTQRLHYAGYDLRERVRGEAVYGDVADAVGAARQDIARRSASEVSAGAAG